jgi:hypothetical protein
MLETWRILTCDKFLSTNLLPGLDKISADQRPKNIDSYKGGGIARLARGLPHLGCGKTEESGG